MNRNLATIIINTLLIATATLTVIPLLWMIAAFMPAMVSPLPSLSGAGRWAQLAAAELRRIRAQDADVGGEGGCLPGMIRDQRLRVVERSVWKS
jgi:hypothetical protein